MAAGVGQPGFGVSFGYASAATTTTFTNFTDVRDINPADWSATAIDITHHGSPSGAKEFVAGLLDGGEVSVTLSYAKTEFTTIQQIWSGKSKRNWRATLPNDVATTTTTITFQGIITKLGVKTPIDDDMETEFTIKVSGLPVGA